MRMAGPVGLGYSRLEGSWVGEMRIITPKTRSSTAWTGVVPLGAGMEERQWARPISEYRMKPLAMQETSRYLVLASKFPSLLLLAHGLAPTSLPHMHT